MLRATVWRWCRLLALALWIVLLLGCQDDSKHRIVGQWKGVGAQGANQDHAEFAADNHCELTRGGRALGYCMWTPRDDHAFDVVSDVPLVGVVDGDRMWLKQDKQSAVSAWVRAGSKLEATVTVFTKGQSLIQAGEYEQGIAALKEAAGQDYAGAQNSLAWVYATAKDARFQDGKKAVAYAEKAVAHLRHPMYLDTLAAALARNGQLKKAVDTEAEALSLLAKASDLSPEDRQTAAERFRTRIGLYQGGRAYTEE